jgi:anaerobic ribonucleoside-triphosphate reductase
MFNCMLIDLKGMLTQGFKMGNAEIEPPKSISDERRQHFIDAVNGGAAVNMAGDLGDDLRCHRGGGQRKL